MYAILDHQLAQIVRKARDHGLIFEADVDTLLDALRDTDDELGRLRQATVGECANCERAGVVVYFDREALVCADYEACVAFCAGRDSAAS
jgi:hypothetical protein